MVESPDPADALEGVAWALSETWPGYWRARGWTRDQLREDSAATDTSPAGPRALELGRLGVRLLLVARSGLAAAEPDLAAVGAAAYLMSIAEDCYLYLGILALVDDPTLFDQYAAAATPRSQVEVFMRDSGIADWCADAGHSLIDAAGGAIRLEPDHVPAPTLDTPRFYGVVSRMRTELSLPGDDRTEAYRDVATSLRDAIPAYRDDLIPAVAEGRPLTHSPIGIIWKCLLYCRRAMAEASRAAARNDHNDANIDEAAITALRFMAHDLLFVKHFGPNAYDKLPLLTAEEFKDIEDPESDIQAWIATHTPEG